MIAHYFVLKTKDPPSELMCGPGADEREIEGGAVIIRKGVSTCAA
jgi:hypothetical protein